MSREIGSTLKPVFVGANGDAKATAFPKADVLGADAQGNIKETTVGDGLEILNGTLKVKAGSNVSVGPSGVSAGTPEIWTFEPISGTSVPKTVLLGS